MRRLSSLIFYHLLFCNLVLSEDHQLLDKVDITCDGDNTDKIIYNYDQDKPGIGGKSRLQTLEYSAEESIYGNLSQNIRISGNGDCYDLVIRLRYTLYIL